MRRCPLTMLSFLLIFITGGDSLAALRILEIRHWSAPDHSRVVIDLDGPPVYGVPAMIEPLTLVMSLRGTILPKGSQEISVQDRIIQRIRVSPEGKEDVQVALGLVKPPRWNIFVLKPYQGKPDRLVIDILRPDLEEKEKAERQVSQELKTKKTRIVVLDPGHGGEDPGAIGPRRIQEKDIVLAMARKLQKALDETKEIRAFLTRRDDYFVPLNDRIRIAQEYGADLFISLHANGSTRRQTRGTSIYCLSLQGASDKATQLLAQKENASDMMGGTFSVAAQKDLDSILLDLEQTHTINESLQLGGIALQELRPMNMIQFAQPRQAGFAVLKAPTLPSILVEAAYITHPVEEKMLKKDSFQTGFAQAMVAAVKKFMPLLGVKEGENPFRK